MKNILIAGLTLASLSALSFAEVNQRGSFSAQEYAALSAQDTKAFNAQLDALIEKAESKVKNLEAQVASRENVPTWNTKLELQNAIIQLEVKKTLVGNFKGSESLQSPKVRQQLINVLSKPSITTADLAELQSLVLEEKAKIKAQSH